MKNLCPDCVVMLLPKTVDVDGQNLVDMLVCPECKKQYDPIVMGWDNETQAQKHQDEEAISKKINRLTEKLDVHLVTCGECGVILNEKLLKKEEDKDTGQVFQQCGVCYERIEVECFPDLFY